MRRLPETGAMAAALLLACSLARPARAQAADSLLVEVQLAGIGAVLVVGVMHGEMLSLPATPLYSLAGLGAPPRAVMTLQEIRDELQVEVVWSRQQMRVVLRDLRQALPASRARLDQLRAMASARAGTVYQGRYTGPFGSITVDDAGETLGELGYTSRYAQVRGSRSSRSGFAFNAAASPITPVWLTYSRTATGTWRAGARVALHKVWVSADYQMGRFGVDGAAAIGPLVVYASSRDRFAITWRGAVNVQVGHTGERSAMRVSFGPIDPSPATVPAVF